MREGALLRSAAPLLAAGCLLPVVVLASALGMLGAGAAAAGGTALSGGPPVAGGLMLPPGGVILAGAPGFPVWAEPCGPEPTDLAVGPSACVGHPAPYPAGYQGFATGQCTWYVATRRLVTWHTPQGLLGGNAGQWLALAAGAGYAVGSAPELGAIAVYTDAGPGHVAFVVGVGSGGAYTVAESNWALPGPSAPYVDLRGVAAGSTGSRSERLAGFIYGPLAAQ